MGSVNTERTSVMQPNIQTATIAAQDLQQRRMDDAARYRRTRAARQAATRIGRSSWMGRTLRTGRTARPGAAPGSSTRRPRRLRPRWLAQP
jgi:hypothetical protein